MSEPLVLETSRLRLVPIAATDAEEWWRVVWSDLAVARYLPPQRTLSREAVEERVGAALDHWADHGFGIWLLREQPAGTLVGHCGLLSGDSDTLELVYALGYPVWGRGLATEAASAALAYGFDALRVAQVFADVFSANTRSSRVLATLGFEQEGQVHRFGAELDRFVLRRT